MNHLLIILSILILSSPLFGLSKGSGVLFFLYGNEDVRWYKMYDGNISGDNEKGNQTVKEKPLFPNISSVVVSARD